MDLLTKLLAPLFVSLLTTAVSYEFSIAIMLGYALVSMCFEWYLANVTFRRWPILAAEEQERNSTRRRLRQEHKAAHDGFTARQLFIHRITSARPNFRVLAMDWLDFIRSPVFPSSLAISLLYMTVLSFEGTFIGWAKSHDYSDPFLAGMRGVNVVRTSRYLLRLPPNVDALGQTGHRAHGNADDAVARGTHRGRSHRKLEHSVRLCS